MSLKDEILAISAKHCTLTPLFVDNWQMTIYIKSLRAKDVVNLQITDSKEYAYPIRLVSLCACDEAGVSLFTPAEVECLSGEGFTQLFLACSKSNDLSNDAVEKKEIN